MYMLFESTCIARQTLSLVPHYQRELIENQVKTRDFSLYETLVRLENVDAFAEELENITLQMRGNQQLLIYVAYLLVNKASQLTPYANDCELTMMLLRADSP
jgi:hypothetical protein